MPYYFGRIIIRELVFCFVFKNSKKSEIFFVLEKIRKLENQRLYISDFLSNKKLTGRAFKRHANKKNQVVLNDVGLFYLLLFFIQKRKMIIIIINDKK